MSASKTKAPEAPNDMTVAVVGVVELQKLQTMVTDAANKRQETVAKLQERRDAITGELEAIEGLLTQMGEGTVTLPLSEPKKRGPKPAGPTPSAGRGTGTRGDNTTTIKGALETLALKHKKGLSRAEFTSKVLTEMGYVTKSDPKSFAASVYTGGIYQMMQSGVLIATGKRPNVIYKHKSNCTPAEIKAAG